MTLAGTNTYLVGAEPAYVIDPGPADERHLTAVREAAAARGGLGGILLTHSHADHSAAASLLDAPLLWGRVSGEDEWARAPDPGLAARAAPPVRIGPFGLIPTPGHAPDHVAFALDDACFCDDVVLGEGSSIVPPRGGGLDAYLLSLERLRERGFSLLCPGHGPWITDPDTKLGEYREHRLERERKLLAALERGERSRERLLDAAWDDVPAALRPAANLAMDAHLEKLATEGRLPEDVDLGD
jgi:glyoxylase-like metal-dependent hydrolase (beta-lactamase superfamily II)